MTPKQRYYKRLLLHKWKIFKFTSIFCLKLMKKAIIHDNSKFSYKERDAFLKGDVDWIEAVYGYGSPEYYWALKQVQAALELHYSQNSHHPEHHSGGIAGMNLYDFVEMYLDWKAVSPDLLDSIIKNEKRFKMSKQLAIILTNQAVDENVV